MVGEEHGVGGGMVTEGSVVGGRADYGVCYARKETCAERGLGF